MQVLEKHIVYRRSMHQFYVDYFKSIDVVTVFDEPNDTIYSNHWLSCIVLDSTILGKSSEELRLALEAENIESRPLWKPMHMQPIYSGSQFFGLGVCEDFFEKGLCLPSGSNFKEDAFDRMFKSISKLFF
jgi:dTDP-4-amino-4,6-dideoxygalactose transaminase